MKESTREAARYYPFMSGRFEVTAGLRPFGTDFGNAELDQKLLQIDKEFQRYRDNKLKCREENIHKYCCLHNFNPKKQKVFGAFLTQKMCDEWPDFFQLSTTRSGSIVLNCELTEEQLHFSPDWELLHSTESQIRYINTFDALCSQLQEDIALLSLEKSGGITKNYLSAVHLCAAGHWSPEDKIGKDFFAIHAPVPHVEKINERAQQFAEMMVTKGPFVRFVWGFATDLRLNHHPVAPEGIDPKQWHGRSFLDPTQDKLYVRVERQVTWGLPEINSGLFSIRVSYLEGEEIRKNTEQKTKLIESIQSMSPETKVYKGLKESYDVLVNYLGE